MSTRDVAQIDFAFASVGPDRNQAMANFSTHTNLNTVLMLLQTHYERDDIEELDKTMDMLQVLIERHRKAHKPGQAAPRKEYQGTIEAGGIGTVRIETDRFHLWIYPVGEMGGKRVQVETEAR